MLGVVWGGPEITHTQERAEANAEFIIRAVNSHADLLAACEAALHLINAHDDGDERTVEELLNQICAALDKARGGG